MIARVGSAAGASLQMISSFLGTISSPVIADGDAHCAQRLSPRQPASSARTMFCYTEASQQKKLCHLLPTAMYTAPGGRASFGPNRGPPARPRSFGSAGAAGPRPVAGEPPAAGGGKGGVAVAPVVRASSCAAATGASVACALRKHADVAPESSRFCC